MTENYKGVTLDELRDNLRYVPTTGKLYWRKPGKGRRAGVAVGTKDANGYLFVRWSNGKALRCHKIAYWLHNGYLPDVVDHDNRRRDDNRADNLRDATHSDNRINSAMPITNTTGYRWVKFDKSWCYVFTVRGTRYERHGFTSAEDAYSAACTAHKAIAKEFSPV